MISPTRHDIGLRHQARPVDRTAAKFNRTGGSVGEKLQADQIMPPGERRADLIDAVPRGVDDHHRHIARHTLDQLLPVGDPGVDEQDLCCAWIADRRRVCVA